MKRIDQPHQINLDHVNPNCAEDITYTRWLLGITQRELATVSGVTPQTIRNWELCLRDSKKRKKITNNLKHLLQYLKYNEAIPQQTLEWIQRFNPPLLERKRVKYLKSWWHTSTHGALVNK